MIPPAVLTRLREHAELRMIEVGLSPREIDIARLFLRGFTQRETASYAGVSEKTVISHSINIYRKCGIHSRSQLFTFFFPVYAEPGA